MRIKISERTVSNIVSGAVCLGWAVLVWALFDWPLLLSAGWWCIGYGVSGLIFDARR